VYLLDTNVISETRKGAQADPGVQAFFAESREAQTQLLLSVITLGELRRGVEVMRHRGDTDQAKMLEQWLNLMLKNYQYQLLPLEADAAQVWGRMRLSYPENEIDKQIAATAWVHGLTGVTRNTKPFAGTGVPLLNPFVPR
jgi:toxin FitB